MEMIFTHQDKHFVPLENAHRDTPLGPYRRGVLYTPKSEELCHDYMNYGEIYLTYTSYGHTVFSYKYFLFFLLSDACSLLSGPISLQS